MSRLTRGETAEPSRETIFTGSNGDEEKTFSPLQLTTKRIDNHTRMIYTLLKVLTIHIFELFPFRYATRDSKA